MAYYQINVNATHGVNTYNEPKDVNSRYAIYPKLAYGKASRFQPIYPVISVKTQLLPVDSIHWEQGKYYQLGSFDNLYHRILTSKVNFNFGIIVGEKGEVFTLWNGHTYPITITDIVNSGLSGVNIIPVTGTMPITIAPYRAVKLQMQVSPQGASSLNGNFVINFSNGESLVIKVTGSRLLLFNVTPNWDDALIETYEYKTDVLTSYNKKEQRRNLISQPRRKIGYSALIQGELLMQFRNKMYGWMDKAFMLPLWNQRTSLLTPAKQGDMTITVKEIPPDIIVGGSICVWRNFALNEIFEIVNIAGTKITLNSPLTRDFDADAKVYPSVTAYINQKQQVTNLTGTVAKFSVDFTVDIATLNIKMPSVLPTNIHDSYEIFDKKPNWAEPVTDEFDGIYDVVDFQHGIAQFFTRGVSGVSVRTSTFLAKNADEIQWWKGFIHRCKGRFKSFLMPSGLCDLVKYGDYPNGGTYFDVRDDAVSSMLSSPDDKRYLWIKTKKGTFYTTIKSVTKLNTANVSSYNVARIELKNPLNASLLESDILQISFMTRCRLASDEVQINYITSCKAKISLNIQQLIEV